MSSGSSEIPRSGGSLDGHKGAALRGVAGVVRVAGDDVDMCPLLLMIEEPGSHVSCMQ